MMDTRTPGGGDTIKTQLSDMQTLADSAISDIQSLQTDISSATLWTTVTTVRVFYDSQR